MQDLFALAFQAFRPFASFAGIGISQITQFPTDHADFLAVFRGGQTIDNNLDAGAIKSTVPYMMFTTAITSGHLEKRGSPIQGEFLLDIFLTQKGKNHIREPQDRQFCEMAVELAKKSVAENDGELHPHVGAVIAKDGKACYLRYATNSLKLCLSELARMTSD